MQTKVLWLEYKLDSSTRAVHFHQMFSLFLVSFFFLFNNLNSAGKKKGASVSKQWQFRFYGLNLYWCIQNYVSTSYTLSCL